MGLLLCAPSTSLLGRFPPQISRNGGPQYQEFQYVFPQAATDGVISGCAWKGSRKAKP